MTANTAFDTAALTAEQHEAFNRDGYLMIRGVLDADEVARYAEVLDRLYIEERDAGRLNDTGGMHLLSAIRSAPELAELLDHPKTFHYVWSTIGWNVHAHHSHLDVNPKVHEQQPYRFRWHQDGGRQNKDMETEVKPRLSVKLAYFLSDLSETGRGATKIIPGSHLLNRIDGPPRADIEWPEPEGAIEVTGEPGDVLFFDRRLFHAASHNYSDVTRKIAFFGYTPRWIRIRDDIENLPGQSWWNDITPIQQQMLGGFAETGDHAWGFHFEDTPLYLWLEERGLLDRNNPPLKPER
ncbi:phytanoyl-CoA dioxygenase family protein [Glycomyces paridis]|uniref:Phytanoyl-CoA dioxygenase family protein n=1 Tax=Glycomyces paridis TaxID=2126555 RepID=A0A4S8PKV4_9ACTN|nr:phytanoyl-CoA dioxygenase family protein [Glycomyces paridis]THV30202.1 phytanoyl-CoA dioxygenase family protein [Glycomyces paridis]